MEDLTLQRQTDVRAQEWNIRNCILLQMFWCIAENLVHREVTMANNHIVSHFLRDEIFFPIYDYSRPLTAPLLIFRETVGHLTRLNVIFTHFTLLNHY